MFLLALFVAVAVGMSISVYLGTFAYFWGEAQ